MHLRVFERVSELVLPEPCFGWILCFKKEEFRVRTGEKREKNRPVLRLTRTQKAVEKRGEKKKRDSRRAFSVFAHQNTSTLRASGIHCASSSFFSPAYFSHTLCARRKITINIHTERGLIKERTFHDARNIILP